jgi:hypothetical protein
MTCGLPPLPTPVSVTFCADSGATSAHATMTVTNFGKRRRIIDPPSIGLSHYSELIRSL